MSSTSQHNTTVLPVWALQRVAAVAHKAGVQAHPRHSLLIAQRAGLNKRLARRCLIHLRDEFGAARS